MLGGLMPIVLEAVTPRFSHFKESTLPREKSSQNGSIKGPASIFKFSPDNNVFLEEKSTGNWRNCARPSQTTASKRRPASISRMGLPGFFIKNRLCFPALIPKDQRFRLFWH